MEYGLNLAVSGRNLNSDAALWKQSTALLLYYALLAKLLVQQLQQKRADSG